MAKAQWRQTGAGPHGDRRDRRNRDRQAQNRRALDEQYYCYHGVPLDKTCQQCDQEEDSYERF